MVSSVPHLGAFLFWQSGEMNCSVYDSDRELQYSFLTATATASLPLLLLLPSSTSFVSFSIMSSLSNCTFS